MKTGTRSLLFGAHNLLLHPALVFLAWWRLYGFPADPRLWIAFLVHDWGYWGKPNMDGPEGETHVELGARIMRLFGPRWETLTRHHSRCYSRRDGVEPSPLCYADKLALCYEWPAFYLVPHPPDRRAARIHGSFGGWRKVLLPGVYEPAYRHPEGMVRRRAPFHLEICRGTQ